MVHWQQHVANNTRTGIHPRRWVSKKTDPQWFASICCQTSSHHRWQWVPAFGTRDSARQHHPRKRQRSAFGAIRFPKWICFVQSWGPGHSPIYGNVHATRLLSNLYFGFLILHISKFKCCHAQRVVFKFSGTHPSPRLMAWPLLPAHAQTISLTFIHRA